MDDVHLPFPPLAIVLSCQHPPARLQVKKTVAFTASIFNVTTPLARPSIKASGPSRLLERALFLPGLSSVTKKTARIQRQTTLHSRPPPVPIWVTKDSLNRRHQTVAVFKGSQNHTFEQT